MGFPDEFGRKEQSIPPELLQILMSQPPHVMARFRSVGSRKEMEELLTDHPELRPVAEHMVARLLEGEQELAKLVEDFVNADSWAESKQMVEAHPELITDGPDSLLTQEIEKQNPPVMSRLLREHRLVLRRCQKEGIDEAFGYWIAMERQTLVPEIRKQAKLGLVMLLTDEPQLYQMIEFSFVPKKVRARAVEAEREYGL